MSPLFQSLLYATLAGATIPVGGYLATFPPLRRRWLETELRHAIIAFGGGILLAAVALVLVPEGTAALSPLPAALAFGAGGLVFFYMDRLVRLKFKGGSLAQFMAMLLDFIPEAMAMGAMLASESGHSVGLLLALLIAMQNLPEGFNAFHEIIHGHPARRRPTLWLFCALVLLGPLAAFSGDALLGDQPAMLGALMLFAAGGIIYLTFQDIAPEARVRNRWGPPLGAVFGFMMGMLGQMLLAG
tara:strand:+ start:13056 stop:13784 length:729 start_codon:yes stop_codon:yes gene_type:complete